MAESYSRDHDEQQASKGWAHHAEETRSKEDQVGTENQPQPSISGALLGESALSKRGSAATRSAMLQRLQQTYGNRAVQRYLQRAAATAAPEVEDDQLAQRIETKAGTGSPIDTGVKDRLEQGLGADLSGVRVHTDGEADKLNQEVDAVAFTTGQDIFFREGMYNPGTSEGLKLLAHEATHTVQQSSGPVAGTPVGGGVALSDPSDSFEQEAERASEGISLGSSSSKSTAGHTSASVSPSSALEASASVQREAAPEGGESEGGEEEIKKNEEEVPAQAMRTGTYARSIQRAMVSVQRHPVEQEEEGEERPKPLQLKRANGATLSLQREGEGEGGATTTTADPGTTTAPDASATPAPAVPDAPSTDAKRIPAIKDIVKGTTQGTTAMKTLDDNSVSIVFGTAGGGSFFSSGTNTITLNPGKKNADLAITLVHEATHAEYHFSKKTANTGKAITTLTKDEYVNKMLTEETEATVRQIETKGEMDLAAGGTSGASTQPGENSYKKAYKAKYDAEIAAGTAEDAAKTAARLAGAAAVKKDFEEGITIVVSIPPNPSYKTYYGEAWEKANKKTP